MAKIEEAVLAALTLAGLASLAGCVSETPSGGAQGPSPFLTIAKFGDVAEIPGSGDQLAAQLGRSLANTRQVLVIGISDTTRSQRQDQYSSAGQSGPGGPGGGRPSEGPGGPGGGGPSGPGRGTPSEGGPGGPNGHSKETPRQSVARYLIAGGLDRLQLSDTIRNLQTADASKSSPKRDVLRASLRLISQSNGQAVWKSHVDCNLGFEGDKAIDRCLAELAHNASPQILEALRSGSSEGSAPSGNEPGPGAPPPQR